MTNWEESAVSSPRYPRAFVEALIGRKLKQRPAKYSFAAMFDLAEEAGIPCKRTNDYYGRIWPLGKGRTYVEIHPGIRWGNPRVVPGHISTAILMANAQSEAGAKHIAHWYDIPVRSVKKAIEFEEWMHERKSALEVPA